MAYTKNVSDFSDSLSVPINHEHRDSTVISHPSLDIFLPVVLYGCENSSLTLHIGYIILNEKINTKSEESGLSKF